MTSDMITWDDVTITERTDQKVKKLTTEQPYHFRVIAFNDVGESKPLDSDEIICRVPKGNIQLCLDLCKFTMKFKFFLNIFVILLPQDAWTFATCIVRCVLYNICPVFVLCITCIKCMH